MVWQVGGPKGHGAELMINIAIVSMHAILYIDILGPAFVMSGGAMAPLAPPVPPPMHNGDYDNKNLKHLKVNKG